MARWIGLVGGTAAGISGLALAGWPAALAIAVLALLLYRSWVLTIRHAEQSGSHPEFRDARGVVRFGFTRGAPGRVVAKDPDESASGQAATDSRSAKPSRDSA
jgi:hypothetical protein